MWLFFTYSSEFPWTSVLPQGMRQFTAGAIWHPGTGFGLAGHIQGLLPRGMWDWKMLLSRGQELLEPPPLWPGVVVRAKVRTRVSRGTAGTGMASQNLVFLPVQWV